MMAKRRGTAREICLALFSEHDIDVDQRTVGRDLDGLCRKRMRRPRCPNMNTPERRAERLAFSKNMLRKIRSARRKHEPLEFIFTV